MKLNYNQATTKELCQMFGVTTRTVVNWRLGSTLVSPLPAHKDSREYLDRIYFERREVSAWGKKNKIEPKVSWMQVINLRKTT